MGVRMKPRVLIASSAEGRPLAAHLEAAIRDETPTVPWSPIFPFERKGSMLRERFEGADLAVFLLSPDEQSTLRRTCHEQARDEALFGAGMFVGMHGAGRAIILLPIHDLWLRIADLPEGICVSSYHGLLAKLEPTAALRDSLTIIERAIARCTTSWRPGALGSP